MPWTQNYFKVWVIFLPVDKAAWHSSDLRFARHNTPAISNEVEVNNCTGRGSVYLREETLHFNNNSNLRASVDQVANKFMP